MEQERSEGVNDETASTENAVKTGMTENELVIIILVLTAVFLVIVGVYVWINRKYYGFDEAKTGKTFVVPKEREVYFEAKRTLNLDDPKQLEELKKLLMRRAMYALPVIFALQNSMNSVQRLYNKGMLTDDVYDNVKEMKAFCDAEWPDIQIEAEELMEGWGPHIWNEAVRFHQMIQEHNQQKAQQTAVPERMSAEKKQLAAEKRREKIKMAKKSTSAKRQQEEADKVAQQLIREEEESKKHK